MSTKGYAVLTREPVAQIELDSLKRWLIYYQTGQCWTIFHLKKVICVQPWLSPSMFLYSKRRSHIRRRRRALQRIRTTCSSKAQRSTHSSVDMLRTSHFSLKTVFSCAQHVPHKIRREWYGSPRLLWLKQKKSSTGGTETSGRSGGGG